MSTIITISTEVTESNGVIDRDAIRSALFCQLEKELDDCETYKERVAQAVNAVFDNNEPGARFLLNHLVSLATQALDVKRDDYSKWEARVLEYVRSNSQGKITNGQEERPHSLLVIGKGSKGKGGVARRADLAAAKAQNGRPESAREQGEPSDVEVAAA